MSAEQFREDLQTALDRAIATGADLEDLDEALRDAKQRIENARQVR